MSLTEPSARRLKPVRLTDIPLNERIKAARQILKHSRDPDEAQGLFAAALMPSRTVYWAAA